MRLLQSVLATLPQTKKPQRKFITHLLGLVLMLPGHATFRNLSRYSSYHERTFARWYDRPFDFVSLNKAAITQVIPPEHQQALVIDASFIPKSGTRTYGLERFWNSRHRRSEKGLEVSAVAWLDITDNCAYGLSVEQTPPSDKTSEPQGTRIDAYLEQLKGVVCDHHLKHLRYVIADGYYSKRKFLDGVRALGLHQIGKLRRDANLRYLYQGLGHPGPGRPKTYDGKVQWDDLSRFEWVQSEDDDVVLYHQVLNHVHLRRNLRVVLVVHPATGGAVQHRYRLGCADALSWVQSALVPALLPWASWKRSDGGRCAVQHRYRLGCADALSWVQSALPDRVSLQGRQAVYVSECLSSTLPSQTAFSLQCQYECSYPGQAGSATAKRQCPGRVFHGESQTPRLQPTSAGANFSAFSPGA